MNDPGDDDPAAVLAIIDDVIADWQPAHVQIDFRS